MRGPRTTARQGPLNRCPRRGQNPAEPGPPGNKKNVFRRRRGVRCSPRVENSKRVLSTKSGGRKFEEKNHAPCETVPSG